MLKIERDQLLQILENMHTKTIMVIGDIMLDEYIWGVVERISPEAPVPVVEVKDETFRLGGAGNVAKNLTSLGARVCMGSVIGNDRPGNHIRDMLTAQGVESSGMLVDAKRRSIVKTRIIANTQQVVRIDKEDRDLIHPSLQHELTAVIKDKLDSIDAIIISDYGKGVVCKELIAEVVQAAAAKNILVNVDPKERNFAHYNNVGLITPNTKELSFGAGMSVSNEQDIVTATRRLFDMLGCKMVLVTRGSHGMSLFESHNTMMTHIPTMAQKVFDVTGAGDTVIACFTLAQSAGATPVQAAMIANLAAGIVVGEVGAASVPWEILKARCLEDICV